MFSGLKRAFGVITLKIKDDIVHIEGIPADVIRKDISKIWSNRVTNNLFESMNDNSFSFRSYFAVEIAYCVDEILKDKGAGASVRSLTKIKEKLWNETWLKDTATVFPSRMDMGKLEELIYPPMEHQIPFFPHYDQITQQYGLSGMLLAALPGLGKAQPLDSLIKVPGGWSTMGDMEVGTKVIAADGSITEVTGVFPQGEKQIYKFTFYDGRAVEACGEHLWNIYGKTIRGTEVSKLMTTYEIVDELKKKDPRVYVELIESEDNPDIPLEMDPYTLGVILGDGGISTSAVTISKEDPEIKEEILKALPDSLHLVQRDKITFGICRKNNTTKNVYNETLTFFGLIGKRSHEKFIPEHYLHGSREQRLSLLQGLLDTDGTVAKDGGTPSFCSTSEALARGVAYLVRSLGGIATVTTRIPHFTYLGMRKAGRLAYIVTIRYKKPSDLFRLSRKKMLTNDKGQYASGLKLAIRTIEPSRIAEAQCISIDHPEHLYVTDGFVVTHNTYSSIATLLCLNKKTVICVVPSNSLHEVWVKTVSTFFKKSKKYWHCKMNTPIPKGMDYYIVTYEYLQNLLTQINSIDLEDVGIILDESHRFNTADSLRTLAFVDLCKVTKSKDVLWLSGTPIKAISTEAIPLFRSLDPRFTEEVETRFKKIYGVSSARATDMMAHRLGITLYRATKKEEVVPPPITITVPVKIPNGEEYTLSALSKKMVAYTREREAYYSTRRKADNEYYYGILDTYEKSLRSKEEKEGYLQFRKDVAFIIRMGGDARWAADSMKAANKYEKMRIIPTLSKEDKEKFKDTKSIVKYVKLKILGECLGNVVSRVRIDCNIDICKHIDFKTLLESTPKKTLVFTSYVGVINALQEKLPKDGFDARFVYAKTNSALTSIIKEFDTKEEVNPLVATFDSLSTAVPILSASCVLMCNQPWRSYIKDQAVARANRIGQDTQVTVYVIVLDTGTEPNVSSRALDVVRWSQEQCEAITGIKSPVAASDGLEGVSTAFEDYEYNYALALEDLLDENEIRPEESLYALPPFMNW